MHQKYETELPERNMAMNVISDGIIMAGRMKKSELRKMVIENYVTMRTLIDHNFTNTEWLRQCAEDMWTAVGEHPEDSLALQEIEFEVRERIRVIMN